LQDLAATSDPSRPVALVRELTKLHEEVWRGSLTDAIQHVAVHEPRGEYVIVLGGATAEIRPDDDTILAALERARADGSSTKDAVTAVTELLGVPKRRVYALATQPPKPGLRQQAKATET
jgi:16S rRNA (cytidine1402-2'-O)-methyltransferase